MKQKLLVFDIDGTLLTSDHQIADSTHEVLTKTRQAGHELCIATGRSLVFAEEVIQEAGFSNYILCNGSAAYLNHQQAYKNTLSDSGLVRLREKARAHEIDMVFQSMTDAKRISTYNQERLGLAMNSFGKEIPELDYGFTEREDVFQALLFYEEQEKFFLDQDFPEFRFVRWHEYAVDVLPNGGSKATTIQWLANHLQIELADVVAFGDGDNDREMLELAGTGVAMGNASDYVKQHADMTTAANDADGIWHAAKKLELI